MGRVQGKLWWMAAMCLGWAASAVAWAQSEPSAVTAANAVRPAVVLVESNEGWGTAFLVSRNGYLLTNNHVVQDSKKCYRNLSQSRTSGRDGGRHRRGERRGGAQG